MKALVTLCLSLLVMAANAQFWLPTQDKSALIEGRILLVEEADFVCNPNVVEQLKKHWKLNGDIQGKTAEEITALLTLEESRKYVVLTGDVREEQRVSQGKVQVDMVTAIVLYAGENAGYRNSRTVDREWIAKMSLPSCLVSEEEIQFFAQHVSNQLEVVKNATHSSNRKKSKIDPKTTLSIREMTLLLPTEQMDVEEAMYSKYYKWPTQLASKSEIQQAVSAKKENTAYLTVLWNDKRFEWSLVAVSCSSGEILAVARFTEFEANLLKKKFDAEDFLSIYRSGVKLDLTVMKYLGKEVTKAEMNAR